MTKHKICIISDLLMFIYYEIPRCATRSMRDYFVRKPDMNYGARLTDANTWIGSYYKFTFIRNPHERLVSCYLQKIANKKTRKLHINDKGLYYGMPFKKFVKYVVNKKDPSDMDVHYMPQHYFIKRGVHVSKLENFENEFTRIRNEIGIPIFPVPKLNSARGKGDWKAFYDDEAWYMAGVFYKKDYDLYNIL